MFLGKLYRLFTISSCVVQNLRMVMRTKRVTPRIYTFVGDIFNKVDGVLDSPLNSQNCMAPDSARSAQSCPTGSPATRSYGLLEGYVSRSFQMSTIKLSEISSQKTFSKPSNFSGMFRLVDFNKGSTALMSCYYLGAKSGQEARAGIGFIILIGGRLLNGLERNKTKYRSE